MPSTLRRKEAVRLISLCTVLTDQPVKSGSPEDAEETRIDSRQRRSVKKSVLVNKRYRAAQSQLIWDLKSEVDCSTLLVDILMVHCPPQSLTG